MVNEVFNTNIIEKQYRALLERLKDVEPEYEELRKEYNALHEQARGLEQALLAANIDTQKIQDDYKPTKFKVDFVRTEMTIPDRIQQILEGVKRPLHYRDIAEKLVTIGVDIGGIDKGNTVLAYISRNKRRFEKAPEEGKGFYKLKE